MDKTIKVLLRMIKSVLCEENFTYDENLLLSEDEEKLLYKICKKHSICAIIGETLGEDSIIRSDEVKNKLVKDSFTDLYNYKRLLVETKSISKLLEEEKISYIKLKGSEVRKFYPKPWIRTSCDIDILVHESDLDKSIENIVDKLGYERHEKNYHDIPLNAKNGICLELHFNIREDVGKLNNVLDKVWEYAKPLDSSEGYEYVLSEEFFVFYLVAHMASHFQRGGCGIKSIIDLYLIRKNLAYDESVTKHLCAEAGIEKFYEYLIKLIKVWFYEGIHDDVTHAMEKFIIHGGVYGRKDNMIAVGQSKKGGHYKYVLSRLFMPYDQLKRNYPVLEKHKYMMPLYQIIRWKDKLVCGDTHKYIKEYETSKKMTSKEEYNVKKLLDNLELY